ncbi:MAG: cold shock domain-containing protein [Candidatus Ruthia sp.]|jgi:CspA family cold shock protein|nr:cold shock domain-containing protein [Candidatus Ruthturnera sp.]MBT4669009.1 cold shock domain-containing protein [Candidatus Ruthturnera sp.]
MAKKIKGVVAQFGTKGYGFITGDDDEKYFVHQKNIYNKSRLKANTRVVFHAEESEKGLVATNVELEESGSVSHAESTPLSDGAIKGMFAVLLILQLIVAYKVFFPVVA